MIASMTAQVAAQTDSHERRVRVVRSPYRVCPLGAHVDHQLGEVTGMALDRALYLAYVPTDDGRFHVESHNFDGAVTFSLRELPDRPPGDWGDYLRGAVWALQRHHPIQHGLHGIVHGSDKVGGLSSSAAVGIAYLLALEEANGITCTPEQNIELDRIIENEYIGLNNGLLDQSTILLSRPNRLMYLDCESGETDLFPCGSDDAIWIAVLHSGLRQQLSDTDYNQRVSECEEAARVLLQARGEAPTDSPKLRHISRDAYERHRTSLPSRLRRRADHFFSEQKRVRKGIQCWQNGDLETMGELITQSGRSSVQNYECGNSYLRTAFEVLVATPCILGARFSGAGFRGCSIGLMTAPPSDDLADDILGRYLEKHPDMDGEATVYFCRPADGAGFVKNPPFRSESETPC